jgi:hypothetical protein
MTKKPNSLALAKKWAFKNKLNGPQAFLRFVMFHFVELLSETSDDFVFKGGNLLWVYIATPRATIDLDFVTLKNRSDETIKSILKKACSGSEDIEFKLVRYKSVIQQDKTGAHVVIEYQTDQGAKNQFELDIVFAIETDTTEISSPINEEKTILSASIENIIADKLSACHRFAAGNTRMKDYDDLWRLCKSEVRIDGTKLKTLAKYRSIPLSIDLNWIGADLERMWKSHRRRYQDLPEEIETVFDEINVWIKERVK